MAYSVGSGEEPVTNEITPAQVAAARERLRKYDDIDNWWEYPGATTMAENCEMARLDRQVVAAADAIDKAKAKGTT